MNHSKGIRNLELSQGQQSLWTGQKLNPNNSLRNVVYTFEINGKLDTVVFKKAFQNTINNVEALRTVFTEKNDGSAIQSVLPQMTYDIEVVDLPTTITDEKIEEWLVEQGKKKLDIAKCVFQTFLVKIKQDRYVWLLNIHHLVTDTVSQKIVFDLTQRFYQRKMESDEIEIDEVPSFEDYHIYEKEQRSNLKNDDSKIYWKNKAKNINRVSQLYGISNKFSSTASSRVSLNLGSERSKKLQELAQDPEIRSFTFHLTLFNIFSSVLLIYLHKLSGQNKLAIGTTNQNRTTRKFKQTVGYFIQIFPLFAEILEGDTFTSALQRIRLETNEYLKHAKSGLITPEISRSYNIVLNFINSVFPDFAGLPTTTTWLHSGFIDSSQYFQCHLTDFNNTGNFTIHFDLNDEVFNTEQKQFVSQHFIKILDAFIADKNMVLSELSLITKTEIEKIEAWNDTTVLFDPNETLLSKFEAQTSKSPNATALVFGKEHYTYCALNEKANQVALFLIQKGVKPNDIVAISLERSFEMMVYIYGILKAGAAYLPLDTKMPVERLRFIANDAAFKLLFFNHDNLKLGDLHQVDCYNVKQIENEILSLGTLKPEVVTSPENLAYVIYTSGSTGEPKGVKCLHKGICNRLNWMNNDYPITENDTLLQKTLITFDVSLWELFWPLQVGAKLVIEIPEGHKDPDQLIQTIRRNKVSAIHFVPSMLNVFIDALNVEDCTSLNRLFCSGEALPVGTVERAYEKLNHIKIYNLYGPTEASVDVTSWHCKKNGLNEGIAIGYPVANTKIHIVDEQLNLVPIGMKGELCIGGVQVASGYLNREKLTDERFINDIFSALPGAKMYKTGDVARYRPDGAIEYLGRMDNQIKLRGIRVELGEIEKVIEQYCNISQVVVIVDKKDSLIAYYTGNVIIELEVKNKLLQQLPEYMIPTHFINLKELPLSKNGKVDRSSLQRLNTSQLEMKTNFIAPEGEIEELLAEIWQEVLELKQVGVHDDFIALGGHSLAAIRVTTRISEEIEMKFPLNKIFESPTISQYGKYIEKTLIALMDLE